MSPELSASVDRSDIPVCALPSGVLIVTESGAFGTIYAFLVTLIVYRMLAWRSFTAAVRQSVRATAMVMILIAGAFAYMLTFYRVPDRMVDLLTGVSENPVAILPMISVVLLLLGMDPLQFGIVLLVNLAILVAPMMITFVLAISLTLPNLLSPWDGG